mmetsp:Transcript_45055/g.143724  ORF Transcript_45055/g.143724 Transcript_45055/m.143724 type:complete len:343 (-) Transcript_45055:2392-3420(-)
MQIVPEPIHEVVVHVQEVLLQIRIVFHEIIARLAGHTVLFILCEESDNVASGQERVDVLQEALVLDLCICEDEAHGLVLGTSANEHRAQVLEERGIIVGFRDRDLENEMPGGKTGQACQRLLAGAAHTHKHGTASLLLDRAVDLDQVLHGIIEEHQIHRLGWICLVEPLERFVGFLLDEVPRLRRLVNLRGTQLLACFSVKLHLTLEIAEIWRVLDGIRELFTKMLRHELCKALVHKVFVDISAKLVRKDANVLMFPQAHQDGLILDDVNRALHDTLEHTTQISHVEDVVKAQRSRQQAALDLVPHIHGRRAQTLGELHDCSFGSSLRAELHLHNAAEDGLD